MMITWIYFGGLVLCVGLGGFLEWDEGTTAIAACMWPLAIIMLPLIGIYWFGGKLRRS